MGPRRLVTPLSDHRNNDCEGGGGAGAGAGSKMRA